MICVPSVFTRHRVWQAARPASWGLRRHREYPKYHGKFHDVVFLCSSSHHITFVFFETRSKCMVKLFLVGSLLLARTFTKSSTIPFWNRMYFLCLSSADSPPPQWYLRGNLSLERDDSCNIFLLPLLSSATKWNCALASWCTLWGVYCSCIKVHSHSQVSFRRSPRLYRSVLTQTHCAVD